MNDKIILIGYRCTGKTSVGKALAQRLGLPFFDTDEMVEKAAGTSIREIVETDGWASFRAREKAVVKDLTALAKSVIATGGGAVLDEENAAVLRKEGALIWLAADAETILKRIRTDEATGDRRPPLSPLGVREEIREILAARTPVYARLADFSIDGAASCVETCVDQIAGFLEGINKGK